MFKKSITSNSQRVMLRRAILYFTALMLLGCSQLPNAADVYKPRPGSKDPDVLTFALTASGQIKIRSVDGKPIPPCGRLIDGKITDDPEYKEEYDMGCNLTKIDLLGLKHLQIFNIQQNPSCIVVEDGGYLYKVHSDTGSWPCHGRH